ncbi:MAG TPA: hypothetical protein VNT75_08635 [Symbiobacteriaceae bacterium]|nr:hypothetical protein [Symbiobacteriaceae bacterium]
MKVLEVNKGDLIYRAEGWDLYQTDDDDVQIMQWEKECAGKLAWKMHEMLRRHALSTNALQQFGARGIIVKRLELIDIDVVVTCTANSSDVTFKGSQGTTLTPKEAKGVPGAKPTRLTTMEDVSLHTARSLRAYLTPHGFTELELHLRFGVEPGGACLLQVPNPLDLTLGSTDYEAICALLDNGGNAP